MILRSKLILPVTAPPIEDGAVLVSGDKIRAVGRWKQMTAGTRCRTHTRALDLGEVILMPGLVNAHCHLNYTDLAGKIPPGKPFDEWIRALIRLKSGWSHPEYARSWLRGAQQLLQSGTTTAADIEAVPELLREIRDNTPLRIHSFIEMTGVLSGRPPSDILKKATKRLSMLKHHGHAVHLSPHAAYSTTPELLQHSAAMARKNKWLVSTHISESAMEFEMFRHARGRLYEWLESIGRDNSDCGQGSPLSHYARLKALGKNVLAAHVNYLEAGDIHLLAKTGTHVVHCPRSHEYFRHARFERKKLAKAGINLCLGTDSLASVRKTGDRKPELDMFAEMRTLAAGSDSPAPVEILRMATINGARALGLSGKAGEIAAGRFADLIALPCPSRLKDVHELVVGYEGRIAAGMIGGIWTMPPS